MLRMAVAFVKRDFLQAISYKVSFILRLLSVFASAASFYFVSDIFEGTASAFLQPYGGRFFPFALIGIALLDYHTLSLDVFSKSIRDSQKLGTLEIILLSPLRLSGMILYSSLWGYIFTSVRFILYLVAGIVLFELDLGGANLGAAAAVLVFSIICFVGLGIMVASLIILLKEVTFMSHALGIASFVLGGVVYPVEVLPYWLQQLSMLIPLTHSLRGMRQALLQGFSLMQVIPEILTLMVLSAIFLPVGLLTFHWAVQRTKVTGTLAYY